jgi:signal transduction histidine kinase
VDLSAQPDRTLFCDGDTGAHAIWQRSFVQATVRDETEARKQRAASAQTERLASMGLLAASMGHEINNPLAYVLSNVEDLAQLLPRLATVTARCSAALRGAVGEEAFSAVLGKDAALLEPAELQHASESARDALEGARRITRISKALSSFARVDSSDLSPVALQSALESAVAMTANEIRFRATLVLDLSRSYHWFELLRASCRKYS